MNSLEILMYHDGIQYIPSRNVFTKFGANVDLHKLYPEITDYQIDLLKKSIILTANAVIPYIIRRKKGATVKGTTVARAWLEMIGKKVSDDPKARISAQVLKDVYDTLQLQSYKIDLQLERGVMRAYVVDAEMIPSAIIDADAETLKLAKQIKAKQGKVIEID